jgi:hypothetical protein
MIPSFGLGNVLPPFVSADAAGMFGSQGSPYPATLVEFVDRFCTSPERAAILTGFIAFREALRSEGFVAGFQWVDGSFVENCEVFWQRPPNDVDVVSALYRPGHLKDDSDWRDFVMSRRAEIFNPAWTKNQFKCDSYYIDLDGDPTVIAEHAAYWVGLFSHQRDTFRWKGMVRVDFDVTDDMEARALIEQRGQAW